MDMEITEEEFEKMDRNTQMVILYQTLQKRNVTTQEHRKECEKKFFKLHNGRRQDKGIAAMFGVVGGFIAGLFK